MQLLNLLGGNLRSPETILWSLSSVKKMIELNRKVMEEVKNTTKGEFEALADG